MQNRLLYFLLAAVLLFSRCAPVEKPVTKEEAAKFAADLEMAISKHQPNFLSSRIILPALTKRMMKAREFKYKSSVEQGMKQGLDKAEFERSIYTSLGKAGSFEKVKLYEKDGIQRVIFRAMGDEGLNYYDMELTKMKDKVGIADMFVYVSGENISQSMAELVASLMNESSDASAEKAASRLQKVKKLMAMSKYKEADEEFNLLPGSIQQTRLAEILHLQITSEIDETLYKTAIADFEKKYGNEANLQLTLLDLFFLRKEYDKAMNAINRLDSMINKDPLLDYYRGLIANVSGDNKQSVEYYKKVTENCPRFAGAYAELTAHYILASDKENAKYYFQKYRNLKTAKKDLVNTYASLYPYLNE